jgi:murein DD-endopeptidase MepM/ murein hydrolase activator NlpD
MRGGVRPAALVLCLTAAADTGRAEARPVEPPAGTAAVLDASPQTVELTLPFGGVWGVVQGFDSGKTHVGYAAFALDFAPAVRLGARVPRTKPRRLFDFPCYGRPVVAPAAGTVVWAEGGAKDNKPWAEPSHDAGNFVILEHAPTEYTELRHLMAGSVKVRVGDKVRRGQPIGRCGNSGTSSTPHVHLGLLRSVDPIATGPMLLSHYEVQGADGAWSPGGGVPKEGEILRPVR